MANKIRRVARPKSANHRNPVTRAQLQQHQDQRIIATDVFVGASQRYNAAAAAHHATADLIEKIIQRWPNCPHFASMLVDRLMAGDEALQQALRKELADG